MSGPSKGSRAPQDRRQVTSRCTCSPFTCPSVCPEFSGNHNKLVRGFSRIFARVLFVAVIKRVEYTDRGKTRNETYNDHLAGLFVELGEGLVVIVGRWTKVGLAGSEALLHLLVEEPVGHSEAALQASEVLNLASLRGQLGAEQALAPVVSLC